jgi:signal transduction histidine kinase/CheY-like chemotaxis protein
MDRTAADSLPATGGSDELVEHSVAMILPQCRAGTVSALVVSGAFGYILVPRVGWLPYLAWLAVVMAGFLGRQFYFERLVANTGATPASLLRIAVVSAVTGWLASTSIPLFSRFLSLADIGVLTILMIGWIAIAVSILSVQPRVYRAYLVACLLTVFVGWIGHASAGDLTIIGLGMVFGGLMLARLANIMWAQLRDSVKLGQRNARLVEQLQVALESQEQAQQARSRFLGAASHDLRQPVHALLLLTDVFRRSTDPLRRDDVAVQITRTAESIDSMFRGLVDLARIDAGTIQVALVSTYLDRLVHSAATGFAEKCGPRGLAFRLDCPVDVAVQTDPVLLERIVRNLLDNAFKFSLGGEISLAVSLRGNHALIQVRDQGVGMDPSDLDQACNAFFRGKSAGVAEAEGIGLGLAICSHMAGLMGARLTLQSQVGAGTMACVEMPLARSQRQEAVAGSRRVVLDELTVAVIEDDRLARTALALWLEDAGSRVHQGASLAEVSALMQAAQARPDFIIADYRLGGGATGLDAIRSLRRKFGPVSAVIVSGESDLSLGDCKIPLLQKPVAPDALLEQIRAAFPTRAY